jgi:ATP-dependent Lon protease
MEVIEFIGYIEEEKTEIAYRYLLPRQLLECGLDEEEINVDESGMRKIIREYTYEAGVRNLEREIGRVCRKVARIKSTGEDIPHVIDEAMVEKFLGPPEFYLGEAEREDEVGVATAIAWTANGGDIMPIEVALMEGKGNLQITGQIGEVMQESVQAALSYIKSRAKLFKINPDVFENMDIHLHVPEGAIPKDGPSAGITIAVALLSVYTNKKVRHEVGMSGEITLRGRVLPIGGVREKVLAAHRAGLKKVILPEKNKKDLIDVPEKVLIDMQVVFVATMDEVIHLAYC